MATQTRMLICDTMCFYYLGYGTLSMSDIVRSSDEQMYYSPVSVIELSSKISDLEFDKRKTAAEAILSSGALLLPDPQNHLAMHCGLTPQDDFGGWNEALIAITQAQSMAQLLNGVPDSHANVIRRLSPSVALSWREQIDGKWLQDMLKIQKSEIPRFNNWYDPDPEKRNGRVPRLTGQSRKDFLKKIMSTEAAVDLFRANVDRAYRYSVEAKPSRFDQQHIQRLVGAFDGLGFYIAVYVQYLIRLLTEGGLPEQNDSGDIELMMYSTDDTKIIVTAERKWERLAQKAGYSQRLRLVCPRAMA